MVDKQATDSVANFVDYSIIIGIFRIRPNTFGVEVSLLSFINKLLRL